MAEDEEQHKPGGEEAPSGTEPTEAVEAPAESPEEQFRAPLTARPPGLPNVVTLPYLAAWRAHRGLTGAQLGRMAGLSKWAVHYIDTGHPAKLETAFALAKALGITVRQLVEMDPTTMRDEDIPPPPTQP